jgi:hypothetical protein
VDTVPDPLLLRKSGSTGNRTRVLWVCSQEVWPLDHRGAPSYTQDIKIYRYPKGWYLVPEYTESYTFDRNFNIRLREPQIAVYSLSPLIFSEYVWGDRGCGKSLWKTSPGILMVWHVYRSVPYFSDARQLCSMRSCNNVQLLIGVHTEPIGHKLSSDFSWDIEGVPSKLRSSSSSIKTTVKQIIHVNVLKSLWK